MKGVLIPRVPHPAVDWSVTREGKHHPEAQVACPMCRSLRFVPEYEIARKIRDGKFSGRCVNCRGLGMVKKSGARAPHPSVDWNDLVVGEVNGVRRTMAAVRCPDCGKKRYASASTVRQRVRDRMFSGRCRECIGTVPLERIGLGRIVDRKGYVILQMRGTTGKDRELWLACRSKLKKRRGTPSVFEHRFVMAKILGRPLERFECVDHMDGNKRNNHPLNLRLYRIGSGMPGDGNYFGTYYQEWQVALSKIRELEAKIAQQVLPLGTPGGPDRARS